jgi:MATE family multidrug resistance protein
MKLALGIGILMVALQIPLRHLSLWLMQAEGEVRMLATPYYNICIWGAPAMLGLYTLTGWFIGMQNTRIPMLISIGQNIVNILASLSLVYGLGMKIEGVALGTLIAQYAGFLVALGMLWRYYRRWFRSLRGGHHLTEGLGRFFSINRDIFLRTLCLVAVNLFFTSAGARQGAVILSVNTVMMQLYLFFSYFMDGFAYAGEALCGKAYGARNAAAFSETLRRLFGWMAAVTLVYTLLYIYGGQWIVSILTDEPQVLATAREYLFLACLIPAAGAVAFIWDGVFVGITATRGMLASSAVSALTFFAVYHATVSWLGNHGLWLAQIVYLAMRGLMQTVWYHRYCR